MGKIIAVVALSLLMFCGGPPSKGTKADKRLKENKPAPTKPVPPAQQKPMSPKKGGK